MALLETIKGFNKQSFYNAHATQEQITSIRVNPEKLKQFGLVDKIHPDFFLEEKNPWCEYGFYLKERPAFTLDPLLHAGAAEARQLSREGSNT